MANYDDDALICLDELHDPLQHVYDYLPVQDLQTLTQVSKSFYNDIQEYCKDKLTQIESKIDKVFEHQLMTKKDVDLRQKLQQCTSLSRYAALEKLVNLRRKSVSKCSVCWMGDTRYIAKEHDDNLEREIVRLITVCWLDVQNKFTEVARGKYEAVIRMDMMNAHWPNSEKGTTLSVTWEDENGHHDMKTTVNRAKWEEVGRSGRERRTDGRAGGRADRRRTPDMTDGRTDDKVVDLGAGWFARQKACESPWLDVCLKEFDVVSVCDVTVRMSDCNGSWKSGVRWDYVGLVPV